MILLLSIVLTIQTVGTPAAQLPAITMNPPNTAAFQYVVMILMENTGIGSVLGNPSAPYLNSLANNYALATNYTAVAHPSLPNYLDLTSATNSEITSDCDPTTCPVSAPNIIDKIESAGLTWKAWAEDYPVSQGCSLSTGNGAYAPRHFPFVYYTDIVNNPARCNNLYSANTIVSSSPETDDALLNALGSTSTAANYMWLTPNLCDDIHDCSISTGDAYLSQLVPSILGSKIFTTQNAALFVTFDEGSSNYPSDYVYSIWAGPAAKSHYRSSNQYSHFSLLKTIETAWALQPLTTNDSSASDMSQFLTGNSGSQLVNNGSCDFCLSTASILAAVGAGVAAVALVTIGMSRARNKVDSNRAPFLEQLLERDRNFGESKQSNRSGISISKGALDSR